MLPLPKIMWYEATASERPQRQPEPSDTMDGAEQVRSYVRAYEWGGPTSALQLHHLRELSQLIRPGDVVLDLACGPGPLVLELAALFPHTQFIGADLSATMLDHLRSESAARGLSNISVLHDDIRTLAPIGNGTVDLVISTSALHHLPADDDLNQVFRRIRSLLKADGGFYLFDFALLNSPKARGLFVAEVAKLAPPITAHDYKLSLDAAFPLDLVQELARRELPKPFAFTTSALVNFLYTLRTAPRADRPEPVQAYITQIWNSLPPQMRLEHLMLRWLRRRTHVN